MKGNMVPRKKAGSNCTGVTTVLAAVVPLLGFGEASVAQLGACCVVTRSGPGCREDTQEGCDFFGGTFHANESCFSIDCTDGGGGGGGGGGCQSDAACDDQNGCTIDVCDLASGLCNNALAPMGTPCLDDAGDAGTCDDFGTCVRNAGPPGACCYSGVCTDDIPENDCPGVPLPGIACVNVDCTSSCGLPMDCFDGTVCTTEQCVNGVCVYNADNEGDLCETDGALCTADFCEESVCIHVEPDQGCDPADLTDGLGQIVENLGIPEGTQTSLLSKLQVAKSRLEDSNPNNDQAACGLLQAFIDQVVALANSGDLTGSEATELVNIALEIGSYAGCWP